MDRFEDIKADNGPVSGCDPVPQILKSGDSASLPMLHMPKPGEPMIVARPEEVRAAIDELLADAGRNIDETGKFEMH